MGAWHVNMLFDHHDDDRCIAHRCVMSSESYSSRVHHYYSQQQKLLIVVCASQAEASSCEHMTCHAALRYSSLLGISKARHLRPL